MIESPCTVIPEVIFVSCVVNKCLYQKRYGISAPAFAALTKVFVIISHISFHLKNCYDRNRQGRERDNDALMSVLFNGGA